MKFVSLDATEVTVEEKLLQGVCDTVQCLSAKTLEHIPPGSVEDADIIAVSSYILQWCNASSSMTQRKLIRLQAVSVSVRVRAERQNIVVVVVAY